MDRLHIRGGISLRGEVAIEGAKNALLPLMTASLLTPKPLTFKNVPALSDMSHMRALLAHLGVKTVHDRTARTLVLESSQLTHSEAPYDIVRKMRASILVLGPLLARTGHAVVSLPGGCAIGVRPIDLHIHALEALGAQIALKDGMLHARAPRGLRGTTYRFPKVSVTGTANLLMVATLAQGNTTIENAACEPEVTDLAHCLVAMGSDIEGIGTGTLHVRGKTSLGGTVHTIIPDRIEAGTYIMAALMTQGSLFIRHAKLTHLPTFVETLRAMGVTLTQHSDGVAVEKISLANLKPCHVTTGPYPAFPTDLQAQMMALLTRVPGTSHITETIFENRFMHVAELTRMGAVIHTQGNTAHIEGQPVLKAAPLMATDLRASACLVLAALAAEGESTIQRLYHLDRGYAGIQEKLAACGANIRRVTSDETPDSPPMAVVSS